MGVILIDGCEDFSSWVITAPSTQPAIVTGRNGNGWNQAGSSASHNLAHNIATADQTDTVTVGFAFRWVSVATATVQIELRSDNGGTLHDVVQISNTTITITRAGTQIAQVAWSPTLSTWYYVESTIKLHDTTGTATVRVNGATLLNSTGLDTKNAGTKTVFDQVRVLGVSTVNVTWDDLYIANDATVLGDIKVETLYPDGNGATNAWAGSDGDSTNNYLLVDESGTPVTTDYVQSSTAGQQDLYTLTNLVATTGTVRGVCHTAYAQKSDSGTRQVKLLTRSSTTVAGTARDLTTTYGPVQQVWTTNPDTSSPYTIAEVNALQSGVETV